MARRNALLLENSHEFRNENLDSAIALNIGFPEG
jgi:hypothetical protein